MLSRTMNSSSSVVAPKQNHTHWPCPQPCQVWPFPSSSSVGIANHWYQNTTQHNTGMAGRMTRGLMPSYRNMWTPLQQNIVPMHTHNARSQYPYPHANKNAIASSSQSHVDGGGDYW